MLTHASDTQLASSATDITGLILAGGLGRRMGGVDKGLINFCGQPLVSHIRQRLQPQVSEVLLNANREMAHYAELGFAVIGDVISDFAGPLAGLHAGMASAAYSYVLSVPCDSPLLPHDLAARLLNGLQSHAADIAVATSSEEWHPVFCLCRTSLHDNLERFLHGGGRRVREWLQANNTVAVDFKQALAFTNVNTPEQLAELEQHVSYKQ